MLNKISFIGVDTRTNLDDLKAIVDFAHKENLDVEFGILYSKTNKTNRYVQPDFISRFLNEMKDSPVSPSIHLCGTEAIQEFVDQNFESVKGFKKVQLNINFDKFEVVDIYYAVRHFLLLDFKHLVVFQYNPRTKDKVDQLIKAFRLHERPLASQIVALFDASGGNGKLLDEPEVPVHNLYCGYAGGIAPNTVDFVLDRIEKLGFKENFYIDMENGVRDNDWFSLDKCFQVAEKVIDRLVKADALKHGLYLS
jgi:hypothetical protein